MHPLPFTAQPPCFVSAEHLLAWDAGLTLGKQGFQVPLGQGMSLHVTGDRDRGQMSPTLRNHLCWPLLLLALFFNFLFAQVLCSCSSAPGQFF